MERQFLRIEFAGFPSDRSGSGVEQDVFRAERKEIGTFPHFAGIHGIDIFFFGPLAGCKRMQIFPPAQIPRTVKQHFASLLTDTGSDSEIPEVAIAPYKRIAESSQLGI